MKNQNTAKVIEALTSAFIVIALWFFPVPRLIYIVYIALFFNSLMGTYRWLQGLITTWGRLAVCGALGFGVLGVSILLSILSNPKPEQLLWEELHPTIFKIWTVKTIGIYLLVLFADGFRKLWKEWKQL